MGGAPGSQSRVRAHFFKLFFALVHHLVGAFKDIMELFVRRGQDGITERYDDISVDEIG